MEPERPFKNVEVIDSRTGTTSKVACMACIRGHRATSCGNTSCQQKVFWTVKRPGRPSNACTCRYGASGRCKCNVVQNACPHRVKGAKRSVDCRCEEQGRYCCYIDAHQWVEMYAHHKPRVDFFPTREDLDLAHPPPSIPGISPALSLATTTTQTVSSLPNTPSSTRVNGRPVENLHTNGLHPQSNGTTPVRFGMMGVGGPWGDHHTAPPDVLQWQGLAPDVPSDYSPFASSTPLQPSTPSGAHTPISHLNGVSPSLTFNPNHPTHLQNEYLPPMTNAFQDMHMNHTHPAAPEPAFDIDKLMADYISYQYPGAICQKCGLNGCTCRNCPPVMQNTDNGSWGNGCSRKHFRPGPARAVIKNGIVHHAQSSSTLPPTAAQQAFSIPQPLEGNTASSLQHQFDMMPLDPSNFNAVFPLNDFHDPNLAALPEGGCCSGGAAMDLSDLIMEDLEEEEAGCCCSGGGEKG